MTAIRLPWLIATGIVFMATSCSRDERESISGIPDIRVSEKVNINDPAYVNLKNINGWAYLDAGSRAIILFRESTELVRAFERHCTFDPDQVCSQVDMDGVLLQANDADCCNSIFSLVARTVIQGPAYIPLLEYSSEFDGTYVTVTN